MRCSTVLYEMAINIVHGLAHQQARGSTASCDWNRKAAAVHVVSMLRMMKLMWLHSLFVKTHAIFDL